MTPQPPALKFRDLNPVGRIIIVAIGALTAGIAAVAFALSYDALYTWVSGLGLWSDKANRAFPLLLDAAFIVAQGAAILAGVMRAVLGHDKDIHRGWPILAMLISGSLTIWFNVLHAGPSWSQRIAAALPPVLMMVCFEIDVSIVKWVMKALGKPLHDPATPLLPSGAPLPYPGLPAGAWPPAPGAHPSLAGYGPGAGGPPALQGQMPWWAPSQNPQNGQPPMGGDHDGEAAETKRQQVEAHLASLDPDELGRLAALGPRAAARELAADLNAQGLHVSERYVHQLWDQWAATQQRGSGSRRQRKR